MVRTRGSNCVNVADEVMALGLITGAVQILLLLLLVAVAAAGLEV